MKNVRFNKNITFDELVEAWLNNKKPHLRTSSFFIYKRMVSLQILPYFSNKKVKLIDHEDIQKYVDHIYDQIQMNYFSFRYGSNILSIFKSIMNYYEPFVISHDKQIAFAKKRDTRCFSKKEAKIIIDACLENINYKKLGILIALFTGIRIGELCALKWQDINFKSKIIHIHKTIQRIHEDSTSYIHISSPKTFSSIRKIPICDLLLKVMNEMKAKDEYYVLSNRPTPIEPRNYRHFYDAFNKSLSINKINFHGLRHTFASMCIEAGIDFKTVSELLGHSSIAITMNTYVHLSFDHKKKCLEKLVKFIG